ncbi:galactosyltransferase-domain-containing protein [Rhodocollybia butyracea]|uniref:Hexosyltransferase n=1 Tax=Rhodocollybia butyracea TaxID=206335 RepID=A0A9P5U3M3_9AGAR|nr:galactosyltransferase-domain-containing protein [Rhodocollybia butyracea]
MRGPPLVLRIGIISQPKEYARRQAFRETTLRGVPKNEVVIHYRFLIGYSGEGDEDRRVLEEHLEYGDIIRLDMKESGLRLGEKRWRMLKWASQAPRSTYDYYLSADTDAFFRLGALARRLPYLLPDLDSPQTQDIFIGRMGFHKLHFKSNPYDNETTFENEDELLELGQYPGEEWYPYPLGYGVMISSHLVDRLTSPEIVLPHHVHYPSDDVVVGQWVADFAPSSTIVDDHDGFHDAIKHSWWADHNKAVDYDSVCVHHVSVSEMQELRDRKEFVGEWE